MEIKITQSPKGFNAEATVVQHIQEAFPSLKGTYYLRIQSQVHGSAQTLRTQIKDPTPFGGVRIVIQYGGNDTRWECVLTQRGVTPAKLKEKLEKNLVVGGRAKKRKRLKRKASKKTACKDPKPRPDADRKKDDEALSFEELVLLLEALYRKRGRRAIGPTLLQSISAEAGNLSVADLVAGLVSRGLIRQVSGADRYHVTVQGVDVLREQGLVSDDLSDETLTKAQQLEAARGCRAELDQYSEELKRELKAVQKELEEWDATISELED